MVRTQPIPQEALDTCRRMKAFRDALKIPRTDFGPMIGIAGKRLEHREIEKTPWKPGEINRAEAKARKHLASCLAAFETTFGHPAFEDINASHLDACRPRSMKLARPLTASERTEIDSANRHLSNVCLLLESAAQEANEAEAEKAKAIEELTALRKGRDTSRQAAETMNALKTQIGLLDQRRETAAQEFSRWQKEGAAAIAQTGALIHRLTASLADQLRAEVASALGPFYPSAPAGEIHRICNVESMPVFNALVHFMRRGIGFTQTASAESIIETARDLRRTLKALLEGGELFTFHSPASAND